MAVDPDPHGSASIIPPGSGSAFNMQILIQGKNLREKQKDPWKLVEIVILFLINKVNVDKLHCFSLLSNLFCLLKLFMK